MTRSLVTGASGFIGPHLVKLLKEQGSEVRCLVRKSSNVDALEPLDPKFVYGDISDADSIQSAVQDVDVVYHLAGLTKSLKVDQLFHVNEQGVRNIVKACARRESPPTLILVSSLAAAGPSLSDRDREETDPCQPVSNYGHSKRAGELAAIEYANNVPTSIVRPPIVLGEGDRATLSLFDVIVKFRFHFVPSFADHRFSIVHADDLAGSLVAVADRGQRVSGQDDPTRGIYFSAADEIPTYAKLGKMIGQAVGRPRAWTIRSPEFAIWLAAGVSDLASRVRRKPHILNLDKAREAAAGSWTCSVDRMRNEIGFSHDKTLQERIEQTYRWYVDKGWL